MIDNAQDDICRYYGDTKPVNDLGGVPDRKEAQIARLRHRIAALVEIVRDSPCPYNGRATGTTVGECQQCGCTSGLFIREPDESGS